MPTSLASVVAGVFGSGLSALPPLWGSRRGSLSLMLLGALFGLAGACAALGQGGDAATWPWPVPGASLAIGLDGLTALFLIPIFLVPALASIYGLGYDRPGPGVATRCFLGLLTAGMATLVLARNSVLFLAGWEAMALSAFFIIGQEHEDPRARRAAWVYLVATHIGTACLLAMFALMSGGAPTLDWNPDALRALPAGTATAVFVLGLLGFGLKAGLMPLHVWLPAAHANAPSHGSAVLSGVMIKMGVYGLVRILILLPPLPAACGAALMALGAVTALVAVASTLGQGDLKRLLAYSSIENIGIVFLGLGLATLGRSLGESDWVLLGLAAALLHVLNHSLFKPLLFLCAGSVLHGSGTRDLDALGGLGRRMPRTGLCFLVGAGAISGVPLLNGFLGEWLLYVGLFHAATSAVGWVALLACAALALLGMTGGLVLLTFVRCSAAMFLGRARSEAAEAAHESPPAMTVPLIVLASLCVALGMFPWASARLLEAVLPGVYALPTGHVDLTPLASFGVLGAFVLALAAASAVGWTMLRRRSKRLPDGTKPVGTWDCGYADASAPRLQYTASSFAQFSARILRRIVLARRERTLAQQLFPAQRAFSRNPREPLLDGLIFPLLRRWADRCARLRILQHGNIQLYLLYILAVLLALAAWVSLGGGARP